MVLAVGPLAGGIWDAVRPLDDEVRPSLWVLNDLPPDPIPEAFLADLDGSGRLLVVEEPVAQGGAASMITTALMLHGRAPQRFASRSARGYPSGQ